MLNRRHLLAASAGAASLGAFAPARAKTTDAQAQALALYDRIFEGMLAADPLNASGLGLDKDARAPLKSRVGDRSQAGRMGSFQPLIDARDALKAIDRSALSGRSVTEYDTVSWYADRCAEGARFAFVCVVTALAMARYRRTLD